MKRYYSVCVGCNVVQVTEHTHTEDGAWSSHWLLHEMTDNHPDGWLDDAMETMHIHWHYGGPGQPYSSKPLIRRRGNLVVITQRGGFDI